MTTYQLAIDRDGKSFWLTDPDVLDQPAEEDVVATFEADDASTADTIVESLLAWASGGRKWESEEVYRATTPEEQATLLALRLAESLRAASPVAESRLQVLGEINEVGDIISSRPAMWQHLADVLERGAQAGRSGGTR